MFSGRMGALVAKFKSPLVTKDDDREFQISCRACEQRKSVPKVEEFIKSHAEALYESRHFSDVGTET